MLIIEVSLPPDIEIETEIVKLKAVFGIHTSGGQLVGVSVISPPEPDPGVLRVVVLKCEYCKAPFVQCKKEHRFCKNPNCRKYAHLNRKDIR